MGWSTLSPYVEDGTPCTCDNCGWKGPSEDLVEIKDPSDRLSAGSKVPAGQCADEECGALAYRDVDR